MADKKIDHLQSEVTEIQKSLNELKSKTISDVEKKTKTEEIKNKAETTKKEIQQKIDQLKDKKDAASISEKEKAETLLTTLNDIINLQLSIWWNTVNNVKSWVTAKSWESSKENSTNSLTVEEEKWFFWKTWERIWNQRNDVTSWDKRSEEPWKNVLRAVWFWITWYAAYKWIKALWNWLSWKKKKNKESNNEWDYESSSRRESYKEKKPFWDTWYWKAIKRSGIWTIAYYVSHWIYTKNRWLKDFWDWERGKKLEFDDAMKYASGAVANQDNKEGMWWGLNLKFHEDTSEIEAYGQKIKIDKEKRKITWLWKPEIEFKKYENMICAAILIAYLKKTYSRKCVNNNPFHLNGSWQGDINVNTWDGWEEGVDWTGTGGRWVGTIGGAWLAATVGWLFGWPTTWLVAGGVWWVWWYIAGSLYDHNNIMDSLMPELDDEHWKKVLSWYLNDMKCRKARNKTRDDITESPIKNQVREVVEEIQNENPDLPAVWWRMNFDAIQDSNDKTKYTIKAYWREIKVEVTDNNSWFSRGSSWKWGKVGEMFKFRNIRILWISWWNPAIKTDMTKGNISNLKVPLKEWLYMAAFLGQVLDKYHHKWKDYPYFDYGYRLLRSLWTWFWTWWDMNWIHFSESGVDDIILTREKFKERMPTIFKANEWEDFLKFLNDGIKDEDNVTIRQKF